jgi:hypothetical protein
MRFDDDTHLKYQDLLIQCLQAVRIIAEIKMVSIACRISPWLSQAALLEYFHRMIHAEAKMKTLLGI